MQHLFLISEGKQRKMTSMGGDIKYSCWQKVCQLPFFQVKTLLPCIMDRIRTLASQRKRQKGMHSPKFSCSYEIKFNNFVIFIMQRKMGMTRRTFLMELARSKGFRVESELRQENVYICRNNMQECCLKHSNLINAVIQVTAVEFFAYVFCGYTLLFPV